MPNAAGIMFLHDGAVFLGKRGPDGDEPGTWAFPGGKIEPDETPERAARREVYEEVGIDCSAPLLEVGEASNGFVTFACNLGRKFSADDEAIDSREFIDTGWFDFDDLPEPLHPGFKEIADMPSTSEAQHRAMEAAAHGHSTLGIPKKVGKEFVDADKQAQDSASGDPVKYAIDRINRIAMDCMK